MTHKDNILVADRSKQRVRVFDEKGNHIKDFGSAILARGVCMDGEGRILVVESGNHRISIFLNFSYFSESYFVPCCCCLVSTQTSHKFLLLFAGASFIFNLLSQVLYSSCCLCGLGSVLLSQPGHIVKVLCLRVQSIAHDL